MADIKRTVDESNDLTVFTVHGEVTSDEIMVGVETFYTGNTTARLLWDFTPAPRLDVDLSNIGNIINRIKKFSTAVIGGKAALVRHPDLDTGMGKIFKTLALEAGLKYEYAIFSEKEAALQWLLQKPAAVNALVVDDESISRRVMQRIMEAHGRCVAVENGERAIAVFRETLETGRHFDLITLDVSMPDIDGIRVLRAIRKMEKESGLDREKPVKILMATAHADSRVVKTCIEAGCDDYIVKPYSKENINSKLQKLGLAT